MTLKGRNLLKMMDFTPEEILYLVDLSAELKEKKHQGIMHDGYFIGKIFRGIYGHSFGLRSGELCRTIHILSGRDSHLWSLSRFAVPCII